MLRQQFSRLPTHLLLKVCNWLPCFEPHDTAAAVRQQIFPICFTYLALCTGAATTEAALQNGANDVHKPRELPFKQLYPHPILPAPCTAFARLFESHSFDFAIYLSTSAT